MRPDRLLDFVQSRSGVGTLAVVACVSDLAERRFESPLLVSGLFDEVAHLALAGLGLLVLACFVDLPQRFFVAALVASVAIDVDHVPALLGLTPDQGRSFVHSLATVLAVVAGAAVNRKYRVVLAGVAVGLTMHLVRDVVEGPPGVRMFWPVDRTAWTADHWWWLVMVVMLTLARLLLVSTGLPGHRVRPFAGVDPVEQA